MGQGSSTELHPLWVPDHQRRYPIDIEEAIIALSQSKQTFLAGPAGAASSAKSFVLDDHCDDIDAGLQYDEHLSMQIDSLVPKLVSEVDFWCHYFGHVALLREHGERRLKEEQEKAIAMPSMQQSLSPARTSSPPPKSAAPDLTAALPNYITSANQIAKIRTRGVVRWGVIGPITQELLNALSIEGHSSVSVTTLPKSGKARHVPSASDLIVDSSVDSVYIGADPTMHREDLIALCKSVCQAGKNLLIDHHSIHQYCYGLADLFSSAKLKLHSTVSMAEHDPTWGIVRKLIKAGHIGSIISIAHRLSISVDTLATTVESPFETYGATVFFILQFIFGSLANVSGNASTTKSIGYEESVSVQFRTITGAVGVSIFNFAPTTGDMEELVIDGSCGQIRVQVRPDKQFSITTSDSDKAVIIDPTPGEAAPIESRFLHDLINGGAVAGGDRARLRIGAPSLTANAKLVDAVLMRFYGQRHDYYWNRSDEWNKQ